MFSGLFKVEWEGDGFIGLNAKTYYCFDSQDANKNKYSAKGLNRTLNLSQEEYFHVLKDKNKPNQENRGFVFKNNKMYSYVMRKQGLTFEYYKRKVLADGVSTAYLEV